jgi:hypothetical protein
VRRAAFVVVLSLLLIGPAAAAQYDREGPLLTHADTRQDLEDVDIAAAANAAARAAEPKVAANAEGLTRDWTCTPSTTDVVGADPTVPQIHVVYAYASDQPNRFANWADRLQGNVSVVQRFLAAQSGGTKVLRFDMRSDCAGAVDITTVPLPSTREDYKDDFALVRDDTWDYLAAHGGLGGPRDLMILADNLTAATNYWVGLGQYYNDDRPGSNNFNNGAGLTAVLWATVNSPGDQWPDTETWWPEGFLHEITHNLGGVQETAEHATLAGHCWDEADVMCYDDGSGIAMQSYCPTGSGTIDESYDCGKDDYYAPAPPAGSYLAAHWNVYNSAFMASCAAVAPACGGAGGPTPTPPVNSIAPGITGTPKVGQALVAGHGTWVNAPTHYDYRWQRETAFGGWTAISGAAAAAYTPTSSDVGLRLRVVVTATNADGAVVAASAPSASVAGTGSPAPTPTPAPTATPTPAPRVTSGRAWLTVTAGSPRGRRLGRVAFSAPGSGAVRTRSLRVARPTGRYAVELCATPLKGTVPTCAVKRLRARAGRLTLPALTARLGAGQRVRATLTVRSLTRRATAATRGSVLLDV